MASIAASPVYPSGLKKRSRLGDSFDLSRKKRPKRWVGESSGSDDALDDVDVAKYSQRHVDYFEQRKAAELARVRSEYDQLLVKKDAQVQQLHHEVHETHARVTHQERELVRLQGENKLLKRAVAIQKQQKDDVERENHALKHLAAQAADHMKRLEQANYTLRVHLQASTSAAIGQYSPPDVF
ncbi:hypothetical protein PsorP6_007847 [Peronosclerospora sorghi]|uniref:Uncharacterized protein n=1 Tax=Peronosclerospora sorghi TaxID=230839 RepID=A0ACC0W7K6_9STRA|nr:hypothetical protein PsorP6_007847 [Peronosclerospora sorghi]